eukprot:4482787-Pleurochrysis_carterae.AAC.1
MRVCAANAVAGAIFLVRARFASSLSQTRPSCAPMKAPSAGRRGKAADPKRQRQANSSGPQQQQQSPLSQMPLPPQGAVEPQMPPQMPPVKRQATGNNREFANPFNRGLLFLPVLVLLAFCLSCPLPPLSLLLPVAVAPAPAVVASPALAVALALVSLSLSLSLAPSLSVATSTSCSVPSLFQCVRTGASLCACACERASTRARAFGVRACEHTRVRAGGRGVEADKVRQSIVDDRVSSQQSYSCEAARARLLSAPAEAAVPETVET